MKRRDKFADYIRHAPLHHRMRILLLCIFLLYLRRPARAIAPYVNPTHLAPFFAAHGPFMPITTTTIVIAALAYNRAPLFHILFVDIPIAASFVPLGYLALFLIRPRPWRPRLTQPQNLAPIVLYTPFAALALVLPIPAPDASLTILTSVIIVTTVAATLALHLIAHAVALFAADIITPVSLHAP